MRSRKKLRVGRFPEIALWKKQYAKKLSTAEKIVRKIRNRDRIAFTGAGSLPQAFEQAMAKGVINKHFDHIDVFSFFHLQKHEYTSERYKDKINIYSGFYGAERNSEKDGNVFYIPNHLGQTGELLLAFKPRIIAVTCTPPNRNGWMSRSLWGSHIHRDAFENPNCEILVAEINNKLPYLCGNGSKHLKIHVSEVDYIIENNYNLIEIKSKASTDVQKLIAEHIAEMIDDGSCLQLGQGGLANAIGTCLADAGKNDLGLHTEVMTSCIPKLMRSGVINNSKKNTHRNKAVASAVVGDKELWDFVDHNEDLYFCEIDYVNDPYNIAKNDKVVSINNAMEVDLTGQIASESIGMRQYTGTGGQFQFVFGAQLSSGGKSIIALNSFYKDKQGNMQSKINLTLPVGSVVTTPRSSVQYIATEYGVANMKFKSTKERAKSLINISHPAFRDKLTFDAKRSGLL